jgi:hypothetical protein
MDDSTDLIEKACSLNCYYFSVFSYDRSILLLQQLYRWQHQSWILRIPSRSFLQYGDVTFRMTLVLQMSSAVCFIMQLAMLLTRKLHIKQICVQNTCSLKGHCYVVSLGNFHLQ